MRLDQRISMVLAVAALGACGGAPPVESETAPKRPVLVEVEQLTVQTIPQTVPLTGIVRARRQATIAAQVMGAVRRVAVEEGQRVSSGQLLIELDDQQFASGVAAARAMRAEADAAIAAGRQAVIAAQAQLALATVTHERYQTLLSKKSASQQEYDVAEAGLKAAQASVEQARASTVQAEAKRAQAEAQFASAETMLGYGRISAPMAGVVTERFVDPGDLASPGMPLLEIEQGGEYQLEAAVPESLISTLRVGQQVGVAIESLGENSPTEGRIAQIDPAADAASRTFTVKASLAAPAGLRSGLYGQLLVPGVERSGLSVPSSAVVSRGQIQSVFTVEDATARLRLVTLGQMLDGRYAVLSGLSAGDRVILDPSGLADGSPVEERR
jgi:multidrug efflux pump subunit AcrA (membrane-fusion protein)